jgi:hypothetical protein
MELISRISKGTMMDQVYIPKQRYGFAVGEYVVIKSLDSEKELDKPFFYGVSYLEPVKLRIIQEIFHIVDNNIENCDNIIISGSFLEKGFCFNDIDMLIVKEETIKEKILESSIYSKTGLKAHIVVIDSKSLIKGLSSDPLYNSMINKCVSKKRFIFSADRKIDYRILDMHLLKSKPFIDNFMHLSGTQKYDMLRNLISIKLFLENKEISKKTVDKDIEKIFCIRIDDVKDNVLDKKVTRKYRGVYDHIFKKIMDGIMNESKQE